MRDKYITITLIILLGMVALHLWTIFRVGQIEIWIAQTSKQDTVATTTYPLKVGEFVNFRFVAINPTPDTLDTLVEVIGGAPDYPDYSTGWGKEYPVTTCAACTINMENEREKRIEAPDADVFIGNEYKETTGTMHLEGDTIVVHEANIIYVVDEDCKVIIREIGQWERLK